MLLANGSWVWLDGTNVTYTKWKADQPIVNPSLGRYCALLQRYSGYWVYVSCATVSVHSYSICESTSG